MNIIFLDVDGVLNNLSYVMHLIDNCRVRGGGYHILDPLCVKRLNKVLKETDANIVISSTWREMYEQDELSEYFERQGVECKGRIVGYTTKKRKKLLTKSLNSLNVPQKKSWMWWFNKLVIVMTMVLYALIIIEIIH